MMILLGRVTYQTDTVSLVTAPIEHCGQCGAPAVVDADGRSLTCQHCGARSRRAVDPALLAAALRAEHASIAELVAHLAEALAGIVPDCLVLERAGGLFTTKHVVALTVTFTDATFHLASTHGRVVSERRDVVRGIALKTHALEVEAWLHELALALSNHATANAAAHAALQRLTTR
jgi:hypothetical protein